MDRDEFQVAEIYQEADFKVTIMKIFFSLFLFIAFTAENLLAQSTCTTSVCKAEVGTFSALTKSSQRESQDAANQISSLAVIESKFDGDWLFEKTLQGRYRALSVKIKQTGDQLSGEYSNASSKESFGQILWAKVNGNTSIIEIDCDWGGRGSVKLTRLKGNRLHWQVIKRDERKGQLIVLQDQILTKQ